MNIVQELCDRCSEMLAKDNKLPDIIALEAADYDHIYNGIKSTLVTEEDLKAFEEIECILFCYGEKDIKLERRAIIV